MTCADADYARPDAAWAWMMAAYFCPFCSSAIFLAAGVVPLKNASQSALIWATLMRWTQQTLTQLTQRQTRCDQLRNARRPKKRRPPENGGHLAALRARPVWIHAGIA